MIMNSLESVFETINEAGLYGLFANHGFGKTTLLMYFANRFSDIGKKCIVFSLDLLKEMWIKKMEKMNMNTTGVIVFDNGFCNCNIIAETAKKESPDVILIDYLQLLSEDKATSLKFLKELSDQESIPILVSGKLSRASGDYDFFNKRPELYDLTYLFKHQTADTMHETIGFFNAILFLHRHHDCDRNIGTAHRYNISNSAELKIISKLRITSPQVFYFDFREFYGY